MSEGNRDRERRSSRGRSRSPQHSRGRSRSRTPPPYRRSFDPEKARSNITNSKDPELVKCRLFIGRLPTDRCTNKDVEDVFKQYGKILGISLHKGYAFVQFDQYEEALAAVKGCAAENTEIHGYKIVVKLASDGNSRKQNATAAALAVAAAAASVGAPPPIGLAASGASPYHLPPGLPPRAAPYSLPPPAPLPGSPYERAAYPPRARSPLRDPYASTRDPYGLGGAAAAHAAPLPPRDPIYDRYDSYGRGGGGGRNVDDVIAPRSSAAAVLDTGVTTGSAASARPPVDCINIAISRDITPYCEMIDDRLRRAGLLSDIRILPSETGLVELVEDISRRGILYCTVATSQNEIHKSLTVNILHGSPQEHRNMPLDDALALITTNFDEYQRSHAAGGSLRGGGDRGGSAAAGGGGGGSSGSTILFPPDSHVSYLLNLLADNRQLSIREIDDVIGYLEERRRRMIDAERSLLLERERSTATAAARSVISSTSGTGAAPIPATGPGSASSQQQDRTLLDQQADLQAKILNILQGGGAGPAVAQAVREGQQGQSGPVGGGSGAGNPSGGGVATGGAGGGPGGLRRPTGGLLGSGGGQTPQGGGGPPHGAAADDINSIVRSIQGSVGGGAVNSVNSYQGQRQGVGGGGGNYGGVPPPY